MSLGLLAGTMCAQATPIDIEMSGAAVQLNNSSLELLLENFSIESGLLPGDFTQAAQLIVSFNSATNVNFDITQNVTIEGVTLAFTMSGLYQITDVLDTLTLFGGTTALFNTGSGIFRLTALGGGASANNIGQFDFDVGYNLEQVPEPGTLALFGIGLVGMALMRRRRRI